MLPLVEAFGPDIQRAGGGLGGAAPASQAEGLDAEGGVLTPAFGGLGTVFHDVGKIRPYSVQIYPTTSEDLYKLCLIFLRQHPH